MLAGKWLGDFECCWDLCKSMMEKKLIGGDTKQKLISACGRLAT